MTVGSDPPFEASPSALDVMAPLPRRSISDKSYGLEGGDCQNVKRTPAVAACRKEPPPTVPSYRAKTSSPATR